MPDRPEGANPGAAFDWADHDLDAPDAPPRAPSPRASQPSPPADPAAPDEGGALRITHVPDRPLAPAPDARARKRPPRPGAKPPSPERAYPKMRALLHSPELVPYGSDPLPTALPPPVPGTFFRAKKREQPEDADELSFDPREEARSLDAMLEAMADGLLIGSDGKGGTEVRVTLRDEYFQGTELRIAVDRGEVHATLVPPSVETYRQLHSELHRLRARLEERGLRVSTLDIHRP